jgi:hypothetical protein
MILSLTLLPSRLAYRTDAAQPDVVSTSLPLGGLYVGVSSCSFVHVACRATTQVTVMLIVDGPLQLHKLHRHLGETENKRKR